MAPPALIFGQSNNLPDCNLPHRNHPSTTSLSSLAVPVELLLPRTRRIYHLSPVPANPGSTFTGLVDSSHHQVGPHRCLTFAEQLTHATEGFTCPSQFDFHLKQPSGNLYLRRALKRLGYVQEPHTSRSAATKTDSLTRKIIRPSRSESLSIHPAAFHPSGTSSENLSFPLENIEALVSKFEPPTSNELSTILQPRLAITKTLVSTLEPSFGLGDPTGFSDVYYFYVLQIIAKHRAKSLLEDSQIRLAGASDPVEQDTSSGARPSYLSTWSGESNSYRSGNTNAKRSDPQPSLTTGLWTSELPKSPTDPQLGGNHIFHRLNFTEKTEEYVTAFEAMLTYRCSKNQIPGTARMCPSPNEYTDMRANLFILEMYLNDTPPKTRYDMCYAEHLSKAILAMVDSVMPKLNGKGLQGLNELDIHCRAFILPAEPWVIWAYTVQELCKTIVRLIARQPENVLVLALHPLVRKLTIHKEWKHLPAYSTWLSPPGTKLPADSATLLGCYKAALHGAVGLLSCYITHLFGKDHDGFYLIRGTSDDTTALDVKDLKFGDSRATVSNSPGIFVHEAGIKVLETCKALRDANYVNHCDDLEMVVVESILNGMTHFGGEKLRADLEHIEKRVLKPTSSLRPTANNFLPRQSAITATSSSVQQISKPKRRPELGIAIPQWDSTIDNWRQTSNPLFGSSRTSQTPRTPRTPRGGITKYPYDIYGPPAALSSSPRVATATNAYVPMGHYVSPFIHHTARGSLRSNGVDSWFQGVGTYVAQPGRRGRVIMAEASKDGNSSDLFVNTPTPVRHSPLPLPASLPPKPPARSPIVQSQAMSNLPPKPSFADPFLDQPSPTTSSASRVVRRPAAYVIGSQELNIGSLFGKGHPIAHSQSNTRRFTTQAEYLAHNPAPVPGSLRFGIAPPHNGGRVVGATNFGNNAFSSVSPPPWRQHRQPVRQENVPGLSSIDRGLRNSSLSGRFRPSPRDGRTGSRPLSLHVDEWEALYGSQLQNPI